MTERTRATGYCPDCGHPEGYHVENHGCTMPLGSTGQPAGAFESHVSICRCREPKGIPEVDVLIENIASGMCDAYLEAILAAAHGRKRALRNVIHPYGRTKDGPTQGNA